MNPLTMQRAWKWDEDGYGAQFSRCAPHHWRLPARDNCPPLRPASEAKSLFCENDRFSEGTLLPPLLAISRCFSGLMDAKPRRPMLLLAVIAAS
jgi:hypothetical protein